MNNSITKTLLLAILLLLLVAPFAALAPLIGIVALSVIVMMVWPLLRILLFGTEAGDRPSSSSLNRRSDEPPVHE
jgi:predicted membrane metal-binding protein